MADEAPIEGTGFGILPWDEEPDGSTQEEAPETETATETTQEPQADAPVEGEPTPDDGEPTYLGKFRGVDALQEGYRQAESSLTRANQEAAEQRRANEALQAQLAEQQQGLDAVAQWIIQQQAEQNPEVIQQLQQQMQAQQALQQAQEPLRQQVEQLQQERSAEHAELQQALMVSRWRAENPTVTPNSPQDVALAQAVQALDLDISDPVQGPLGLDLALEASQNPALLQVLRLNPHWIEMEGGIEYARQMAGVAPQGNGQPVAQTNGGRAVRPNAFVETGGQGAPTSGAPGGGKDEFDEAIAAWKKEHNSPLFQ